MAGLCNYGTPTKPGSPLVFFCDNPGTERFNWPMTGGRAVRVTICREHLAVMEAECERDASLPAVLSSVEDVARVAEAAGLAPQGPAIGYAWSDEQRSVIAAWDVHPGCVQLYRNDTGEHYATYFPGATGTELFAAIQAARGGEVG